MTELNTKINYFFVFVACFSSTSVFAQGDNLFQPEAIGVSQAVHGGVGLIQTPTARMSLDGGFNASYHDNEEYRYWTASIQVFPWLETTARYVDIRNRLYSDSQDFSGDQTLKDKGIDAKIRLWQESYWLPEVSVGFRDIGGTGVFQSEYVAASKRWGNLDFHLGMGWGYLGLAGNFTNPFCKVKDSFCDRGADFDSGDANVGRAGQFQFGRMFKGPVSLFGGVEYQTPWLPLRLKLEYEGNDYSTGRAGALEQKTAVNIGAVYRWHDVDLHLNYQRGNTVGFGVTYAGNFNNMKQVKIDKAPQTVKEDIVRQNITFDEQVLRNQLRSEGGFSVTKLELNGSELVIYGRQRNYRDYDEGINRVGRVLANNVPSSVKTYRIVILSGTQPMLETVVKADDFAAAARYESLTADVSSTYIRQTPQSNDEVFNESAFGYGVRSFWVQMLGSPEAFYMYQGGLLPYASAQITSGLSITGVGRITVLENFDKFNFKVDSQATPLQRVRTYAREYVTRSRFTVDSLYTNYRYRLSDNIFTQAYAGYLETMFGGAGMEMLYRPVDSGFAIGFDINYVKQRSYENDFSFMDYSVTTGHINMYWEPSFLKDSLITVNVGRYLAGDKGVTFDFARRFDSGIIVGAYAALTNVSSRDYGEGSFTKGFYMSIPFDMLTFKPATGRGYLPWTPIARDGGQALHRPVKLIDITTSRGRFLD